jgi:hypothetical protein
MYILIHFECGKEKDKKKERWEERIASAFHLHTLVYVYLQFSFYLIIALKVLNPLSETFIVLY